MKLFTGRDKNPERRSQLQDRRALGIAVRILSRQRKIADYLNRKTAGVTAKGWLAMLIAFCTLFGSYCLWLLMQAFG